MKRHLFLACLLLALAPACSSNKVKPVNDNLDVKGKMGSQEIGLTDDKEAVIQDSVAVDDELRGLSWKNYEAERKLGSERDQLIACRTDLADPRLGGNKKLEPIPELEMSKDLGKVQEQLGLNDNGQLKVVKKQNIEERLAKEKQYNESLNRMLTVVSQNRVECERELGYVRVDHGLPSERYPAQGYYGPQGNYIVTRPAERSLDDAFRIQAEQTRQGKKIEQHDNAPPGVFAMPPPPPTSQQ